MGVAIVQRAALFVVFVLLAAVALAQLEYNPDRPWERFVARRPTPPTPAPPAYKTRSLTGARASDGYNQTRADVLKLVTVGLLEGFAIRRVKAFNDRIFLARYRRSYWLGTRYYELDNRYFLATRESCVYRMDADERKNLEYEDGEEIHDIIYQCQRYAQFCCGLDCCDGSTNK